MDNIDPNLCTHIVFSRISLDIEKINIRVKENLNFFDVDNGHKKFIELKVKNPQLKLLIYLKPDKWNAIHVELMANSSHVEKIVSIVQQYAFDGISLDFFPTKEQKIGFTNLVKTTKKAFLPLGYFLVIAGSSYENRINDGKPHILQYI